MASNLETTVEGMVFLSKKDFSLDATVKSAVVSPTDVTTAAKSKRRRRPVDQSAGLGVTVTIVLAYAIGIYASLAAYGSDQKAGLRFHSHVGWMQMAVSDAAVFGLPLLYVAAVLICSRLSALGEKQHWVKRAKPIYNLVQIVLCSYMVIGLLPLVDIRGGNPFGLNQQPNKAIEWFVFIHYLSKFLDWCDTFFMIASQSYRQISFLQVFHHATVGMIWGILLNHGWGSGTAAYGAFINSVTHVLMYSHYLWTSTGRKNPFKRYLTKFQLAQFASCVLHAAIVVSGYEKVYPKGLPLMQVMYHPIMLFLFGFKMSWAPLWLTGVAVVPTTSPRAEKKDA